jgi:DNA-binding PadR family transcriptional regulator
VKTPGSREHKHYVITPKGLAEFQSRKRSWRPFSQGMKFVLSTTRKPSFHGLRQIHI